jgi:signal transduction histidine kinase
MNRSSHRRVIITNVAIFLTFAAAAARGLFDTQDNGNLVLLIILLAIYLSSVLVEPRVISHNLFWLHAFNGFQAAITFVIILFIGQEDYFALLFIPISIFTILNFRWRTALFWIIGIVVTMIVVLILKFPINESVGYVIIYPCAIFLFTSLCLLAKEAEDAQNRSAALLFELQDANQKLQLYASQVEELTATKERNRLARELHDSVTQIIFSLTLSAQAARILIDRDHTKTVTELDHLQSLAQSALKEMRSLIQELHPSSEKVKLTGALEQLVVEQKEKNGLRINLQVVGKRDLPGSIDSELLRIVQEAVINIVKHSQAKEALIKLDLSNAHRILLGIEDSGVGFDPGKLATMPGHLGLISMQERVHELGGELMIDSSPGNGTRLQVIIDLKSEGPNV